MSFDQLLQIHVGDFGRIQVLCLIIILTPGIMLGMSTFDITFSLLVPDYSCKTIDMMHINASTVWRDMAAEEKLNIISPRLEGQKGWDPCAVYDAKPAAILKKIEECPDNFTECMKMQDLKPCEEWEYAQPQWEQTLVARFNLVCDRAWMKGLAKSVQLMGQLLGMLISGTLSDKFGRRVVVRVALVVSVIIKVTMALSPVFPLYLVTRLFCGCTDLIVYTSSFLLCTELLNARTRSLAVVFALVGFAFGGMISPLVAYLLPNWTYLSLTTTALGAALVLPVFILPESPRWLFCAGRKDLAKSTLQRMANINQRKIPPETSYLLDMDHTSTSGPGVTFYLRHKLVVFRLAISMYLWFCSGIVYYGLALNVSDLAGNIFINTLIMNAIDLPGDILIMAMVKSPLGRRYSTLLTLLICTVALYTDIACPRDSIGRTVLAVIGKMTISTTFSALYVITPEMFPTGMCGTALGCSSAMARLGSSISPFIAQSGGNLVGIIFGTIAAIAVVICLALPETRNHSLPVSVNDMKQQRSLCPSLKRVTGQDKKTGLQKESEIHMSI